MDGNRLKGEDGNRIIQVDIL